MPDGFPVAGTSAHGLAVRAEGDCQAKTVTAAAKDKHPRE